ncbi:hypothetical protein NLU13_4601 [Sarocladium strictum]|uniref:DUF8035 domain-containing protein n=1 Tax=Sarocladium strictum TaxID=5046 RepID=A0AA39GJI0_SARSR|nr:hypothetical protein NLU13_4601 [Sarocladium strictum]
MAPAIMSPGDTTVEHIDAVDAFARNLYLRLKQFPSSNADPPLDDVALAVKQLHLALRHLRVEAADRDSPLNRPDSAAVHARQLESLVEDCGFQLKQLDTALATIDIYEGSSSEARTDRLGNLRAKIANEKTGIDMFLDTIQLRNPADRPAGIVDGSQTGLENIKDKVDAIANSLFAQRARNANGANLTDDEDRLWQEFKSELEKEGFSPQVLRRHKEVLRAYIRELETMSQQNGGLPPTVRGLLEHEAKTIPTVSPKEMYPAIENEKFFPSMKDERRMPDSAPLARMSDPRSSYEREQRRSMSSEDSTPTSDGADSMAMISTRDLMAMDHINASMTRMHLQAPNQHYSTSPGQRFLPSSAPTPGIAELAGSPGSMALSASPRSMTTLPPYASPQLPAYSSPRTSMSSRLAPDAYGNEIPMEAQWTKVRRSLLSLEVLDRAGVRYEARPEYVAILGRLTREEIEQYARQSAECRAARSRKYSQHSKQHDRYYQRDRADSKSSRDEDDDDSVLWDESDSTDFDDDKTSDKGTKSYPYIVNFPEKDKEKISPSSTVQPKSILKNKNENHVRFDPQPHEVDVKSSPERDRDRDRDRRSRRHRSDEDDGHRRRYHPEGGRNRRSQEADREMRHHHRRRDGGGGGREREHQRYHRDRDRDEDMRRDEKSSKKKAWGETLGAVGIGGAAVSLLSVLAEAATGI